MGFSMKQKLDKKYFAWGLTAFLVICGCLLFTYLIFNFNNVLALLSTLRKILMPIIDGIAIAYLLTPILNFVESKWVDFFYRLAKTEMTVKKKKQRRGFSIFITMILFSAVLYIFFRIVIPQLILSIQSIIFQFPIYVNNLGNFFTKLLENNPELESTVDTIYDAYSKQAISLLQDSVLPKVNDILKTLSSGIINFIKGMFNIIIGIIISIYLMSSKEVLSGQAKKIVYSYHDRKSANKIIAGTRYTHRTFIGFVGGKIIDSIIIGIVTFIVTNIVGTPYAVLVSVIVGVTNIIPFFGPYIGAIPSTLLILMVNPIQALYFVIIILIIQQVDGNIIGPKILGDSTGLSSFWVIFAITLFGGLFGVAGMIIGVPTFAVIYALFRYKVNKRLRAKNLPVDTTPYINLGSIENDNTFIEYVPVKGRSLLQILGIQKMDVVKREILFEEEYEEKESPADVNVVHDEIITTDEDLEAVIDSVTNNSDTYSTDSDDEW